MGFEGGVAFKSLEKEAGGVSGVSRLASWVSLVWRRIGRGANQQWILK